MRKGSANTARGARRFIDELIARVRRAGATGEIVVRVDSGFWSNDTIATLGRLDVRYTMAVRTNTKGVAAAIAAIDEDAWRRIDYTPDGEAQVAECTYKGRRLIVRRTRLTDRRQLRLWPDWRHFAFLTDLAGDAVERRRLPPRPRRGRTRHPRPQRRRRDWNTFPRATSTPTAPGCSARCWPTTSSAGPPPSASPPRSIGAPSPAPSAPAHRHARPPRQPRRHPHPARPAQLAMAPLVPRRLAALRALQPAPGLTRPAARRTADDTRADNLDHSNLSVDASPQRPTWGSDTRQLHQT